MALSEIEKLERRYAENPQGLTFAPLAEAHRKIGDVARALELLHPGLQQHPDYIPASIVLGRCHLDLGDLPAAEVAFARVLDLDGENVIALKALADINERLHRFDQAERWLHQLLSLDRSNDQARAQLEGIETARAQTSAAARSAEAEAVDFETEDAKQDQEPLPAPVSESGLAPVSEAVQSPELAPLGLDDLETTRPADADQPPPDGLLVEETEQDEVPVEPLAGLVGREVDRPDAEEFLVETGEDIILRSSGGSEFQMPDASMEFASAAAPSEPGSFGSRFPQSEVSPDEASPGEASRGEVSQDGESPGDLPPREGPSAPVYSGSTYSGPSYFVEDYAESAYSETTNSEPVQAIPESPQQSGVEETPETPRIEAAEPPRRAFAAIDTKGESVARFFQRLLAARPPVLLEPPVTEAAPTPAPTRQDAGGAPTRPAADALSLSSVFGEETSHLPPAVAAPGAPATGVSFDEFFSPPGAAPGARAPRNPDAKNDDLDQFHAWLQNLKR